MCGLRQEREAALAGGDRSVSGGRQIPRVLVSWKTDGDGEMPEAREFKSWASKVTVRGQLALFCPRQEPGEFDSRNYYRGGVDCRLYGKRWSVPAVTSLRFRNVCGEFGKRRSRISKDPCRKKTRGSFWPQFSGIRRRWTVRKRIYTRRTDRPSAGHQRASSFTDRNGRLQVAAKPDWGIRAGLAGAGFIFCYGAMTGGSPSVTRAVIMMGTGFLASYLGRTYDLLSALSLALLLLAWETPELLTQGGVQMSFGAVFAVGSVLPVIQNYLGKKRSGGAVGERCDPAGLFRSSCGISFSCLSMGFF